jgi:hypothetical protein
VRWELVAELVAASRRSLRKAIDDAHLAAIAISRGATLASCDEDFAPFERHGLRWERVAAPRSRRARSTGRAAPRTGFMR